MRGNVFVGGCSARKCIGTSDCAVTKNSRILLFRRVRVSEGLFPCDPRHGLRERARIDGKKSTRPWSRFAMPDGAFASGTDPDGACELRNARRALKTVETRDYSAPGGFASEKESWPPDSMETATSESFRARQKYGSLPLFLPMDDIHERVHIVKWVSTARTRLQWQTNKTFPSSHDTVRLPAVIHSLPLLLAMVDANAFRTANVPRIEPARRTATRSQPGGTRERKRRRFAIAGVFSRSSERSGEGRGSTGIGTSGRFESRRRRRPQSQSKP